MDRPPHAHTDNRVRVRSTTFYFIQSNPPAAGSDIMYDLVQGFLDDGRSFGVDWWEETWMQDPPERYNMYGGSVQPLPLPRVLKDMYILPEMI